jgi:hypothetical protein
MRGPEAGAPAIDFLPELRFGERVQKPGACAFGKQSICDSRQTGPARGHLFPTDLY